MGTTWVYDTPQLQGPEHIRYLTPKELQDLERQWKWFRPQTARDATDREAGLKECVDEKERRGMGGIR